MILLPPSTEKKSSTPVDPQLKDIYFKVGEGLMCISIRLLVHVIHPLHLDVLGYDVVQDCKFNELEKLTKVIFL